MNALAALAGAVPLLLVAPLALAQERPQAFLGARILPITGPEIPKGVLVVHHGKIVAVGPEGTRIPEGDPFAWNSHCVGTVIQGEVVSQGAN